MLFRGLTNCAFKKNSLGFQHFLLKQFKVKIYFQMITLKLYYFVDQKCIPLLYMSLYFKEAKWGKNKLILKKEAKWQDI